MTWPTPLDGTFGFAQNPNLEVAVTGLPSTLILNQQDERECP